MGLLGLLKSLCPEPEAAGVVVHGDVTTAEVQVVRVVAAPWVSTRRPIVAVVANVVQLTRDVVTQGGQVEVVVCIGSRREARVDTTIVVAVVLVRCTQVGCTVGRFLGVVMILCL